VGRTQSKPKYALEEFRCHRCGNCCKGDGIVNMLDADILAAARLLAISTDAFLRQYTTESEWGERWLVDNFVEEERWCVFLERDEQGLFGCRLQHAKPQQCKDFPYKWRSRDAFNWCEGLRR